MRSVTTRAPSIVALMSVFAASFPAFARDVQKTDLFVAGEGGYAVYRIPGLVAYGKTVLA